MKDIDDLTISEITEYINERNLEGKLPETIKMRIKTAFDLTKEEAEEAYNIWKKKYMRARIKS